MSSDRFDSRDTDIDEAEVLANVGEVAYLRVSKVDNIGAFLRWGRPKELLLPFGEQRFRPDPGKRVLVMIYVDDKMRPVASMKLDKFIKDEAETLKAGDEVILVVSDLTDLGAKVIVNHRYWGLVFHDDINQEIRRGDTLKGYVKQLRDDQRLDITLLPPGAARLDVVGEKVLAALIANQGFLPLNDKSAPELIKREFGVSKNAFKQAIGRLYKNRQITIEEDGIRQLKS